MILKALSKVAAIAALFAVAGGAAAAQRSAPASHQGGTQSTKPQSAQGAARQGGSQRDQSRPPVRKPWWIDDAIKKELGLTPDQVKTLDQIYTSAKDELSSYWQAREREEKELERLIDESKVEQWVVARQIDKVETQRSNFNKLRSMMLYRMHRQLTPDQRVKLQQIQDRDRRDPRTRP